MADYGSPSGHVNAELAPLTAQATFHSANGEQSNEGAASHSKEVSTAGPSSQDRGITSSNTALESPKKTKLPIAAAAADREIALKVWMESSEREDDVRDALGRMMGWVEQLAGILHTTLKAKAELETTLTVTQSNLALALSNTEMLEAALKRDASGRRADVGWTRSTVPSSSPATAPLPANSNSNAPITKSETGFFKFLRNSGGVSTPPPGAHHLHRESLGSVGMHTPHSSMDGPSASTPNLLKSQSLTSPSMPSLHAAPGVSRREEELAQALQRERASTTKVLKEKQQLEEELESLSQALFEEANKMVSTERRQRAQVEEELQNVRQEREALKGALRIVEGENLSLRSGAPSASTAVARAHHSASSSSSDAIIPLRDRTRALTIDTDRAGGQGDQAKESAIDLTQTPSTSELPSQNERRTPTSTVNTKPNAALMGIQARTEEPEDDPWRAANGMPQTLHSRKGTGESGASKTQEYNVMPRGSLTFGM